MSDDKTAKEAFLGKTGGRRKAGRPKLRWLDCIENDVKSMCVSRDGGRKQKIDPYGLSF
jgi:hypothetical protein